MKHYKILMPASLIVLLIAFPAREVDAQTAVLEVIKAGVKKAIKALDLKIQRMQNETIWLQNAQKVLENQLSKLKLSEIAEWTEKQRQLYAKYYEELWKIKAAVSYYHRIRDMTQKQLALVEEYKKARSLFRQDGNFTAAELEWMDRVYAGILDASVKNLDQILLVVNSFKTQMSDAARLELISQAADKIDENYNDLRQFNNQNKLLSLQRAKDRNNIKETRRLYGID